MDDPGVRRSTVRGLPRAAAVLLAIVVVAVGWATGVSMMGSNPGSPPVGPPGAGVVPDASNPSSTMPTSRPEPPPAGTSPSTPSAPVVVEPSPSRRMDPVFGMSGHLMWHDTGSAIAQLDMMAADGLGIVRFDVAWRGIEPERGAFRYLDKLDTIVDAVVVRGITPVISIVETPAWANGGRSAWDPPDDPADYAAFAGMLAARYAGRVAAWEVWNEPDTRLFWRPDPDPARYTRLLVAASAAIREADPGAKVVGGSITFGNTDYVRAMYRNGAKGSFDALSVHPYTLGRAPDDESDRFHSLTAILDDVHEVMTNVGDAGTPIWITELGWAVVGLNSVPAAKRIDYLAQSVGLIRERPWVHAVTAYTIDTRDSERHGLSTGGRRSAAWRAYVAAVHATAP